MRKILVMASVMLFGVMSANAANNYTPAGTDINNTAVLSYEVGGISQGDVNSATDQFVVDNKVDLVVAHKNLTPASVTPGDSDQVISFTVRNDGNKVQDYNLTALANDNNPFGLSNPDDFDATNVRVFVDANNNGTYESGTDTATFIDELAPDANVTVLIVANIPSGLTDGKHADYTLVAETREGGTSGTQGSVLTNNTTDADIATTEQNIFADATGANSSTDGGANNAKHSDNNAYQVAMATLSATKTSIVTDDPVYNGGAGVGAPHRIPGATVRYCFDINNTGSADADKVRLHDDFTTNNKDKLDYQRSGIVVNSPAVACDCAGNVDTTGTAAASSTDIYIPAAAAGVTIPATGNACAYIEATIK